jgi:hypothetical protein
MENYSENVECQLLHILRRGTPNQFSGKVTINNNIFLFMKTFAFVTIFIIMSFFDKIMKSYLFITRNMLR